MKTLILYATKHGAAREIAQRIANKITGAALHDLKQGGILPLAEFDCVIIGSSVYVGMIRKEAKAFLMQYAQDLQGKKLGLFVCGLDGAQEQEYFKTNFSPDILQTAKAISFLGGIFDPKKASIIERFMVRVAAKQSGYTDTIDNSRIAQFVEEMR